MFDTIIFILLGLIALVIAWKIIKNVLKALMIVFVIMLFVVGVLGFLLYKDVTVLENEEFLVIYDNEGPLSAVSTGPDGVTSVSGILDIYDGDYSVIESEDRVLVLRDDFFSDVTIEGTEFEQAEFLDLIDDDNAVFLEIGFEDTVEQKGYVHLVKAYKAGDLEAYPRSVAFRLGNYIPNFILWILFWVI